MSERNGLSEADISRSTPGKVYGVGIHCSGEMESFTPDCPCPCHLADAPGDAGNTYCDVCGSCLMRFSYPERTRTPYPHEQAISDGRAKPRRPMRNVPDYYFITKGNTLDDELKKHYKTEATAGRAADTLNLAVQLRRRPNTPRRQ